MYTGMILPTAGLYLLEMGLWWAEGLWEVVVWGFPAAIVSLCPSVGVQMSFYQLTKYPRPGASEACYQLGLHLPIEVMWWCHTSPWDFPHQSLTQTISGIQPLAWLNHPHVLSHISCSSSIFPPYSSPQAEASNSILMRHVHCCRGGLIASTTNLTVL